MSLIPALRRQRWVELCEFKASLVYIVSSWPDDDNGDDNDDNNNNNNNCLVLDPGTRD